MMRAGLQAPELQIEVHDRLGNFLGRTDLGYPEDSAVIEFDGKVKYQNGLRRGQTPSDVVIVEKKREDAIRSAGVAVLRVCLVGTGRTVTPGGSHHRESTAGSVASSGQCDFRVA